MFAATIKSGQVLSNPDVCKTPTPGGPVPMPYPNTAMNAMATPPVLQVLICNSPALNKGSKMAMSNGDQAGTAGGGVVSGSFMGKCEFTTSSMKVKLKGKPAIRQMDQAQSNKGNCFGALMQPSQTKVMFG